MLMHKHVSPPYESRLTCHSCGLGFFVKIENYYACVFFFRVNYETRQNKKKPEVNYYVK